MALAFLRRHRRWFFVFLWVVILAFVILYIPNLDPATQLANTEIATVGGHPIPASEFQKQYLRQRRQFLAMNQGQIDESMLERMGLREQVLSSMLRAELEALEADRLGFQVDDQAVIKAITEDPQLQTGGRFVGTEALTRLLQQQGMTVADFENEVRRQLKAQRLREAVTDGVRVSDADVSAEFRRRSELMRAEYVHIPTAQFEASIQPTDDEIKARFEANKDRFRLPERRVLSYLLVDPIELRAKVLPTGSEIENYYRANTAEFTTPPQVCGRHILVKVKQEAAAAEGHEDGEAKALAEAALARLKAGEAFEKVAKEKSEDTSAANGGSLGCFAREQMVPEFSSVAFGLQPGAMSDVIRTSFGYHIIKADTILPGSTQPLEQARKRIEAQLQDSKARDLASRKAEAVSKALQSNQSLEQIATAEGLAVKKSEPLQLGQGAGPLTSPVLLSSAFELKAKETSKDGFPAGAGAAFIRLDEILPQKTPELAEVKEDVRKDLVKFLAREKARQAALSLAADAERTDLTRAAAKAKLTRLETKGLVGRGQAFTEIPQSSVLEDQAFELAEKKVSAPLDTPSGVAIVRVLEKKSSDETALAQQRDSIRESLVAAKKDRLFSSYLQTLTDRYPITRNAEALAGVR
ncbi:MAG TPA: peptidyl-prolyl cis-trans isomerase [Vicinamibacteria bacterium]|nr:peptidyl-prolyl cis-trans isomerase [Vicinamibacteria bacterium]HRB13307.1 peptidyl-prolyl cis-trans isomerase [Vicinamibacteria bacterium]